MVPGVAARSTVPVVREILIAMLSGTPHTLAPGALTHVSLVSPSLVRTVLLVAVSAVVLTGLLAAARVRPGRRRAPRLLLAATVVSLLLSQVLVLGAVGLKVNASLGFVQTVGDLEALASSEDAQGGVRLAPVGGPSSQDDSARLPADFVPQEGGFSKASVTGARSGVTQDVWVWTPRGYSASDQRSYPVVFFLHGVPGSSWGTVSTLKAGQAMQEAIDSGALPPSLFVIPDLNADAQQQSNPDCADIVGHAKVGTWIQDDVPAVVRASFPNVSKERTQWAIAGLSSGGYCAGWTAIMRSDVFGSAMVMSGYDVPVVGGMSTSTELRLANTLSTLVSQHHHQPLNLWVLGAEDDHDAVEAARALRETVPRSDSVETVTPSTGGHSWTLWSSYLPRALAWWGQTMGDAQADSSTVAPGPAAPGAPDSSRGGLARLADTIVPVDAVWTVVLAWAAALAVSVIAVRRPSRRWTGHGHPSRDGGTTTQRVPANRLAPFRSALGLMTGAVIRTVLVALACMLSAIAVGLLGNHTGEFYSTWGDATSDICHALEISRGLGVVLGGGALSG